MSKAVRALFVSAAAFSAIAFANAPAPKPTAELKLASTTAKKNSEIKGTVTVTIPSGYHCYQNPPTKDYMIPLKITATDKKTTLKTVSYPKGKVDEVAGEKAAVYSGKVTIPVVFKVGKAGKASLSVKVDYQMCDDSSCQPPSSLTAKADVTVK